MHSSTFEYLKPTDDQMVQMKHVQEATHAYAKTLEAMLPDGPDKTYALRTLRTVGMWCMVSITRHPDGSPRE